MNDPDPENDPRPMSDGLDHDAIFAEIVAHLNDEGVEPERPTGPRAEDASAANTTTDDEPAEEPQTDAAKTDRPPSNADPQVEPPPGAPTPPHPQSLPAAQVWRAREVDHDEEDEHFEPPPVAPLPVGDLQFWAIIAGMGGGPLLLLYLVLFNREASSYWILAAIAMSVGGFALLVARLPGNQGDDDGARL